MAVRFLHLADLHLGSRHEYLGNEAGPRSLEVMETFRQAVNVALDPERGIDGVLISGNLFDRHEPDPETLSFARGLLGRLVAHKKPVVIVPGYRDAAGYRDSVYRTERWPGVDVITSTLPHPLKHTIRGQEVFFYGSAAQPGTAPERFPGFERQLPEIHGDASHESKELGLGDPPEDLLVGNGHGLMAAHIADPGLHVGLLCAELPGHEEAGARPFTQTVDPAAIAGSELDYIALGGYHGFATYEFEGTAAAYPGTLAGRRFERGDAGRKSLLVVNIEQSNVAFTRVPVNAAHLEEWTIDLLSERITDPDGLCAAILARAASNIIARIKLVGPLEFICDLEKIATKVRGRFRHLELVDRTDLVRSGLLRRIQGEHTIRGFFARRMLKHIADLEDRALTAGSDSPVHRELTVARAALKVGLEQFLDEEHARDILYKPPADRQGTSAPSADEDMPEATAQEGA
ncbi:MAG: hypothetical protein VX913_00965 [Planctomycetota bacterium]|nr:hypothetical protein [Planctomycetota bacterium]